MATVFVRSGVKFGFDDNRVKVITESANEDPTAEIVFRNAEGKIHSMRRISCGPLHYAVKRSDRTFEWWDNGKIGRLERDRYGRLLPAIKKGFATHRWFWEGVEYTREDFEKTFANFEKK